MKPCENGTNFLKYYLMNPLNVSLTLNKYICIYIRIVCDNKKNVDTYFKYLNTIY